MASRSSRLRNSEQVGVALEYHGDARAASKARRAVGASSPGTAEEPAEGSTPRHVQPRLTTIDEAAGVPIAMRFEEQRTNIAVLAQTQAPGADFARKSWIRMDLRLWKGNDGSLLASDRVNGRAPP